MATFEPVGVGYLFQFYLYKYMNPMGSGSWVKKWLPQKNPIDMKL